ncbi:MAG TPA: hotdog domain-containing protein [Thermopolyspora sp.]
MTLDFVTSQESSDEDPRLAAIAVLAEQTRRLMDAIVQTDVGEDEVTAVTAELAALTERLRAAQRAEPYPHEIGPDGAFRHVGNAVTGICNPYALPLMPEIFPGGSARAELEFRLVHEGPPGGVHGGVSAMVLDHLLGISVGAAGRAAMTGTLSLRYIRPVPYGEPLTSTAEIGRTEGRKTWAHGRIAAADGTVLVEATGLFITPAAWVTG